MTNEEIAKAAYDAGFSSSEILKRLAAFKSMIDSIAAAEREACAKVCEARGAEEVGMTREELLRIMRLLSALEAVGIMHRDRTPDYLLDDLAAIVEILEREILK